MVGLDITRFKKVPRLTMHASYQTKGKLSRGVLRVRAKSLQEPLARKATETYFYNKQEGS